jgi:hypothetical protein
MSKTIRVSRLLKNDIFKGVDKRMELIVESIV